MRKALVVGINYYEHASRLYGCVNDAHAVKNILERNSDGSINFEVKFLSGTGSDRPVLKSVLREHIQELFKGEPEIAMLYFAGHGHIEETGGYLIASDAKEGHEGIPLVDIITFANNSEARNRIIVLDSCHSGIAGDKVSTQAIAELKKGTTILTASTAEQYAAEENRAGVFTTLFVNALEGEAGDLVGNVTPGSVYAHIDQSLGQWAQRPVFKTNVEHFVSLRRVQSPISLSEFRQIKDLFPSPGFEFKLDPSFEPELKGRDPGMPPPNPENTSKFAVLQKYNRVNLVVPVDAPHMWHAAMKRKSCKLTVLGEHYRRLVEKDRI